MSEVDPGEWESMSPAERQAVLLRVQSLAEMNVHMDGWYGDA
ncbi:hypothetical protein HOV03_gp45 [Gordonia phage Asapag]|uniref:Uncharacterized protein n=2 Tax=Langleyhallvirinae TaxID=2732613 RepID=A0A385DZD4_9CAUD|nr:hypothetical protein HOT94_gp049 [Gordonia phage Phistory]YP_009819090.1 hypothetical protein HOV03_gp45 [Gordonia phage Asapag]AXQ64754.1 hypothetical protein SEA_PHISTORY_49 [Gordonia phage Phistory]QAU07194.1 hypothetical protein SEA_ASAPAG_45 [Gordonia phage Asapag]UTN91509.1 hypothetical protein SEA_PERIWINKLE_55 [Gordonia phage Periwinkle]